jgi:hypothetical protein
VIIAELLETIADVRRAEKSEQTGISRRTFAGTLEQR